MSPLNLFDLNGSYGYTNNKYSRNLIRNEVVPLLKKINPNLERNSRRVRSSSGLSFSIWLDKLFAVEVGNAFFDPKTVKEGKTEWTTGLGVLSTVEQEAKTPVIVRSDIYRRSFIFLAERPSIANPSERAMVNEDVEVIVVWKLRRKGADGVSYCDLFGIFIWLH